MNAVIYRRVSTSKQDESMLMQEGLNAAFCAAQQMPIVAEFSDPDVSGSIPMQDRPGGRALLGFLEAQKESYALVALKQDRLGRDSLDQISTIRRLWGLGVTLFLSAEGGRIERTPENEMMFTMKAGISQYERSLIQARIMLSLKAKRERGELCGTVPFGWDAVATGAQTSKGKAVRKMVPNEYEQTWLKQIWRWRTKHGWAYNQIAKQLNRLGVPTKEAGRVHTLKGEGAQPARSVWQCGNVARILQNAHTVKLSIAWEQSEPGPASSPQQAAA